jgi:phage terminase large subunit-like protein
VATLFGRTEPRLWTRPLRDLTPETSLGFEVIDFALEVLGVDLYPWQRWLLIHALELREDGAYRFRRVVVLVARQNGKTMLAAVLSAWWIFVDSARHPERVPPVDFKVVGTAQNLDIARGPWAKVKTWCDPDPETIEEAELAIPMLQASTAKVVDAHGQEGIYARSRAHYEMRAAGNSRGKPAARVLMDELREQKNWVAWNAVSQTTKSFWSGQLWGISNAGDPRSVVLKQQRDVGLELNSEWDRYVEAGIMSAEAYANDAHHDVSLGLFEWSAPDECPIDDVEGILQANPSIGYGAITVEMCISDSLTMPNADYRTEVLCQWVDAQVNSYITVEALEATHVSPSQIVIPPGSRTVWGVDTSQNRSMTYVAAAVLTADGRPFVTVRTQRAGMLWLPAYMTDLAEESGQWEVAVQSKGAPSMEFVKLLEDAGFTVHGVDGSHVGIATGRFKDRIRDHALVTVAQPLVRLAVEGGVTSKYAENDAWSRVKSVTDVAPVVAETMALYGLELCEPPVHEPVTPPPPAEVLRSEETSQVNLATVVF